MTLLTFIMRKWQDVLMISSAFHAFSSLKWDSLRQGYIDFLHSDKTSQCTSVVFDTACLLRCFVVFQKVSAEVLGGCYRRQSRPMFAEATMCYLENQVTG
ncbi:hypothetical protein AMECASPLE_038835 [Ameca splendens]|uniref:Uncharacterized protein n=1 Tax=Ameca splendens TaxID=208324 RepID=A0ABV0YVC9_9TELE